MTRGTTYPFMGPSWTPPARGSAMPREVTRFGGEKEPITYTYMVKGTLWRIEMNVKGLILAEPMGFFRLSL